MSSPSMVHRSGDTLVVRSVVSGDPIYQQNGDTVEDDQQENSSVLPGLDEDEALDEEDLPQCKIKRNYTCAQCNFYSQNPRSYLYHLKDEHKQKIKVYECPRCLYASKHSQKLQRHVHMVHVMGKTRHKKKRPKVSHAIAPVLKSVRPPTPLLLDEPVKEQSPKSAVKKSPSKPGSNGTQQFSCSICPWTSQNQTLVTRHERIAHLKKKFYRCGKCNYVTHMKARYTKHVKYHSMPMIKCDLCDFRTPYKWNLDRHYKNHTGDGAFKCSLCNFTADIKQSLTVHEMNHHVPPVGQQTGAGRRRNKVGASDSTAQEEEIDQEELELLRMEREDGAEGSFQVSKEASTTTNTLNNSMNAGRNANKSSDAINTPRAIGDSSHTSTSRSSCVAAVTGRRTPKIKMTIKKMKPLSTQEQNERHNFQTDFIHPDDIIHHKNGNVYIKTLKCGLCNFKAAWEGEMARHESRVHGIHRPGSKQANKKVSRPIPNLIPIQNKTSPPHQPSNVPILKIPSVRSRVPTSVLKTQQHVEVPENKMSEKDLNEICAKSCPTSSLKDFASLIGDEDAFKISEDEKINNELDNDMQDKSNGSLVIDESMGVDETNKSQTPSPMKPESLSTTTFKKKNASFFDKLKEKLGASETCNLLCPDCGYESKCLSELARHQKLHKKGSESVESGNFVVSGAELSSTRCQHCRQRCKTSADLIIHLQSCPEARKSHNSSPVIKEEDPESSPDTTRSSPTTNESSPTTNESSPVPIEPNPVKQSEEPHPMVNKVFVWNSLPQPVETETEDSATQTQQANLGEDVPHLNEDSQEMSIRSKSPISESSLVGIETAPGYGAVTSKLLQQKPEPQPAQAEPNSSLTLKKVFKCPHCTFWASTASRFHVHIVGHLNKKPFECSLCAYRSNWRWDITKHIRLKSARDLSHERARVLMTDETGRRNYSKYNKYLTLMRVHEPTAESSGSGRRTKNSDHGSATTTAGGVLQQHQLPALPRLTRAPTIFPKTGLIRPGAPLRPPPPLRAAHQLMFPGPPPLQSQPMNPMLQKSRRAPKRPIRVLFGEGDNYEQPSKRSNTESKKTLWKCKKCNYRDASRELVLAHVKEHYQQRAADSAEASVGRGLAPFRCGHCHQVSNWKHVIQRHCRLKHSGDVRVLVVSKSGIGTEQSLDMEDGSETDRLDANPEIQHSQDGATCDKCPFMSESASEMASHKEQHISRPGAIFKCYFCPFYVPVKGDLLEHMRLHGVCEPEDYISKAMQGKLDQKSSPNTELQHEPKEVTRQYHSLDVSPTKRYRCAGCPYVSNSKSQFLYHKQFHRPRGAPFKCGLCSYNVSRRHLLHQHLRVHGILVPPQKSPSKLSSDGQDEGSDGIEEVCMLPSQPLDTRRLPDIPLVWVSRGAKFSKMFKCRFCPHVNVRKANIQEHEKMHRVRKASVGSTDSNREQQLQQHRCPDCNYVCNNAGVLSSHAKVHQGLYGHVHCLVDASRTDEAQLEELTADTDRSHDTSDQGRFSESILASNYGDEDRDSRVLYFCSNCPARFLFEKELSIHVRFHENKLAHRCESCSYTARQRPHLMAHLKVHTEEYQGKTNALVAMYQTSTQHPRPRTAVIVEGPGVAGPVWVVISGTSPAGENQPLPPPKEVLKQFSCSLCPAKFFKSVALQYHRTLHGGLGQHKCRRCDYAVKTYGNLVKHEMIHDADHGSWTKVNDTPESGTDLLRAEAQRQGDMNRSPYDYPPLHVDPQFGILMHGNPDFIYPTYFKNGRLKEKRYKCHKCPSAFEKREQYKVHLSLHGSKQRYNCEKCDYSVKYFANYIQHMRKHQNNEEAQVACKTEVSERENTVTKTEETAEKTNTPPPDETSSPVPQRASKTISRSPSKSQAPPPLQLSSAERQSLLLLHQRRPSSTSSTREEDRKLFNCPHCPYSSNRRDGVESHIKRHVAVSGVQGNHTCSHCDYSVPQLHFLREHVKVHFGSYKKGQPEAYMKCERIELWASEEGKENLIDGRRLIFQDHGSTTIATERFQPACATQEGNMEDMERIYVDINTGEPIVDDGDVHMNEEESPLLPEVIEQQVELGDEVSLEVKDASDAENENCPSTNSEVLPNTEKMDVVADEDSNSDTSSSSSDSSSNSETKSSSDSDSDDSESDTKSTSNEAPSISSVTED